MSNGKLDIETLTTFEELFEYKSDSDMDRFIHEAMRIAMAGVNYTQAEDVPFDDGVMFVMGGSVILRELLKYPDDDRCRRCATLLGASIATPAMRLLLDIGHAFNELQRSDLEGSIALINPDSLDDDARDVMKQMSHKLDQLFKVRDGLVKACVEVVREQRDKAEASAKNQ